MRMSHNAPCRVNSRKVSRFNDNRIHKSKNMHLCPQQTLQHTRENYHYLYPTGRSSKVCPCSRLLQCQMPGLGQIKLAWHRSRPWTSQTSKCTLSHAPRRRVNKRCSRTCYANVETRQSLQSETPTRTTKPEESHKNLPAGKYVNAVTKIMQPCRQQNLGSMRQN